MDLFYPLFWFSCGLVVGMALLLIALVVAQRLVKTPELPLEEWQERVRALREVPR